jgi:hypothetical protein
VRGALLTTLPEVERLEQVDGVIAFHSRGLRFDLFEGLLHDVDEGGDRAA